VPSRRSNSAAAGKGVHARRPFNRRVGDGFLGGGGQIEEAFARTALHLFYEDAAVGEPNHAELADEGRTHRTAHVIGEDVPSVEIGPTLFPRTSIAAPFSAIPVAGVILSGGGDGTSYKCAAPPAPT